MIIFCTNRQGTINVTLDILTSSFIFCSKNKQETLNTFSETRVSVDSIRQDNHALKCEVEEVEEAIALVNTELCIIREKLDGELKVKPLPSDNFRK